MNKRIFLGSLAAVVAIAVAAIVLVNRDHQNPRGVAPVKIGAILPLTGPAAAVGEQIRNAIVLASEETPGFQFVFEDSANVPTKGVAAFQKLTSLDGAKAVVVAMSGISASLAPLANSERIPTFAISTSVPVAASGNEFLIRYFIDGVAEARSMAEKLPALGFKRIAIVQINDEYGLVMLESFKETLHKKGLSPIYIEPLEKSVSDFRVSAERIKGEKPDCVYFIGYAKPLGIAIKQTHEAGLRVPYATTFGFEIPGTRELAGPAVEGIIYTSIPFGDGVDLSEQSAAFVKAFTRRFGSPPSNDAAFAYDLVKNLPALANPKILKRPAFLATSEISSQFGKVTFNDRLEAKVPIIFKTIVNGEVRVVK